MHSRAAEIGLAVVVAAALAGCGGGGRPESGAAAGKAAAVTVAKVAGKTLTQRDLDDALRALPQHLQGEYAGAMGRQRLLESVIERELMLKAAIDQGLERDSSVAKQLQQIRTSLLVQAYQRRLVESRPKPTEAEIRAYYDQHPEEFVIPARINASFILCATRAAAEKARRRIVERGEEFRDVALEVSIDETTKKDGGLLGYFNPTGYIRSVGADTAFARQAFRVEAGDVGEIFPFRDGWAFVKAHEKSSERPLPYEQAQDRIRGKLTPTFTDSLLQADLVQLRGKYKVAVLYDPDRELAGKSADDIMRMATEAGSAQDKIGYYQALLRRYPNYERADEAQFMIGFVYSEGLREFDKARPEYEKVLQNYPQSDIRESARYMLEHMGQGSYPQFQDAP
jgi:EpsD family peptidyl-prolyl cis-trans isomerase